MAFSSVNGGLTSPDCPAYDAYGFNIVLDACATGSCSFGRELGHNLGLAHDHDHDHDNAGSGLYTCAHGHQEPADSFRTIMAADCSNGCTRLQHFSNPEVAVNGKPIGVLDWADNALALSESIPSVATWRDTVEPTLPAAPSALNAAADGADRIALSWSDNALDESGYLLKRSADGVDFSRIATVTADEVGFEDTGMRAETFYFYRVRAYNGAGNSPYSNDAWASTKPAAVPAPNAPGALVALALAHDTIDLSWSDNADDETGYRIERSSNGGSRWSDAAVLAADTVAYTDTGLDAGAYYLYRVQALGADADSTWSNQAGAQPIASSSSYRVAGATSLSLRFYLSHTCLQADLTVDLIAPFWKTDHGKTWTYGFDRHNRGEPSVTDHLGDSSGYLYVLDMPRSAPASALRRFRSRMSPTPMRSQQSVPGACCRSRTCCRMIRSRSSWPSAGADRMSWRMAVRPA